MSAQQFKRIALLVSVLAGSSILSGSLSLAQFAPPVAQPPAGPVPATRSSIDEIQAAIDAKQYTTAVKTAGKLLSLHGPAGADVDRFQITMLKGYAQAGMHSISTAVMTFKSAKQETKDPRATALADWTAELFHTAGSTTFTSKSMGPNLQKRGPFDLLNADQRKEAFAALLDDNLSVLEPKLKVATVAQTLAQIWPVLQQVVQLDQLDLIANGNDDKTTTLAGSLLDHSRDLLSNAVKADWTRVSDIDTHANVVNTVASQMVVNNSVVTQTTNQKNGLTSANKDELSNIISVCQKIHDAAETFMSVAKSDKDWSTILSDADRVAGRASDVLNADYGTASSTSSATDYNGYNNLQQVTTPVQNSGATASASSSANPPKKTPPTKTKNGTGQ